MTKNYFLKARKSKEFYIFKRGGFFQDKQKPNRIKDFIEVDDLMDHLNEESKEG